MVEEDGGAVRTLVDSVGVFVVQAGVVSSTTVVQAGSTVQAATAKARSRTFFIAILDV